MLKVSFVLKNRPIVLPIVHPENLSLSMLIDVMLIKKKECNTFSSWKVLIAEIHKSPARCIGL